MMRTTATIMLFAWLCVGCQPSQSQTTSKDERIGLQIRVLNYMDQPLGVVYVNGVWAGAMASHAGGNSMAGTIGLPAKWKRDLTVEVEWQDDALYQADRNRLYRATVPVEPYDEGKVAMLWLAFFPGNKIKAIPSGTSPGFPGFPGGLQLPEDVCQADPACAAKVR